MLGRRDFLSSLAASAVFRVGAVHAESWPQGPITLIVPLGAGGTTDILGRVVADRLAISLGKPVIVDNRSGGGGTVGTTAVARAKPDGYTLLVGHIGTLAVNPGLHPKLGYDPLKDFTYIAPLARTPNMLVVNPSLPVRNAQEFLNYARANPRKINYGSSGIGSGAHIAMAALSVETGIEIVHVPYRGTAPAVTDVISGQIQAIFTGTPLVLQQVRAGKLRALGVSTERRIGIAQDVPAIAETVSGFEASQWHGIVAPAGLASEVGQMLSSDIRTIMHTSEVASRLDTEGAEVWDISSVEFREHVAKELPRWKRVIDAAQISVD